MKVKGDFMKIRTVGNQILRGGFSPDDKIRYMRRKRRVEEASRIQLENHKRIREECWKKFHGDEI